MKLYGYPTTPFVQKVVYALEHKNAQYEHDEIFPWGERERLNALNPASKVPVMEIDGKLIPESTDIVLALDKKFPDTPSLMHKGAVGQAAVLEHLSWVEAEFPKAIGMSMVFQRIIKPFYMKEEPDEDVVTAGKKAISELYAEAEKKVPETGFLTCNSNISLADVSMWAWMRAAEVGGVKVCAKKNPKLAEWYERMNKDEVTQRVNKKFSSSGAVKEAIAKKYRAESRRGGWFRNFRQSGSSRVGSS